MVMNQGKDIYGSLQEQIYLWTEVLSEFRPDQL